MEDASTQKSSIPRTPLHCERMPHKIEISSGQRSCFRVFAAKDGKTVKKKNKKKRLALLGLGALLAILDYSRVTTGITMGLRLVFLNR